MHLTTKYVICRVFIVNCIVHFGSTFYIRNALNDGICLLSHAKSLPEMAGLSRQERSVMGAFVASERATVGADDLAEIHPVSRATANQMLTRLQRKGWLQRIRRGVYTVVPLGASTPEPAIEDAWPIAMRMFTPCFISGWSAAEHWDLTEQVYNAIAVVTTHTQRRAEQYLGGVSFRTRVVTAKRFFGYKKVWFGSRNVSVADPHRLIIDVLDDPSFGGGGRQAVDIVQAYWKSKYADATTVLEYAQRYGRGAVFKRLGFLTETFGKVDDPWIVLCRNGMTAGISNLDPAGPVKGKIISRWGLRINMPVGEP